MDSPQPKVPREDTAARIRTLTSVLHTLKQVGKPDPYRPPDTSTTGGDELKGREKQDSRRHLATLLTIGKENVAITVEYQLNGVKLLVAVDSTLPGNRDTTADSSTSLGILEIRKIERNPLGFDAIIEKSPMTPPGGIAEHIADFMALVSAVFDPDHPDRPQQLSTWVTMRSIPRLRRYLLGEKGEYSRTLQIAQTLLSWSPSAPDSIATKHFERPSWVKELDCASIHDQAVRCICEGEKELKWKFSSDTVQSWAVFLGTLLTELAFTIEDVVQEANEPRATRPSDDSLEYVDWFCSVLYKVSKIYEDAFITLLCIPSLARSLKEVYTLSDDCSFKFSFDEEFTDQDAETVGRLVQNDIESLTLWKNATRNLLKSRKVAELYQQMTTGLVQVHGFPTTTMPADELYSLWLEKNPDLSDSVKSKVGDLLYRTNFGNEFRGTIHAEAILMGFLDNYPDSHPPKKLVRPQYLTLALQNYIRQLLGAELDTPCPVIFTMKGVSCCFCEEMGRLISSRALIPDSTKTTLYTGHSNPNPPWYPPWCPPVLGMNRSDLASLEAKLWEQLRDVVLARVSRDERAPVLQCSP